MTFKTMIATSVVALGVAASAMASDTNFSGAYIGGNLGYGAGTAKTDNNKTADEHKSSEMSLNGVIGGLHTGYQYQMGMFILGAEASANLSNNDGSAKSGDVKTDFKRKNAFGLAARAGIALNSWMTYAKLGWETAKFNYKIAGNTTAADNISKSSRLNGFVTGLGLETLVAKNIMIGAEWTYTFYKKKTFVSGTNGVNKNSVKPRIGDFKVRLGYKF